MHDAILLADAQLAGGILDWGNAKVVQIKALVIAVAALLAVVAVVLTWWRTKAAVPTLVTLLLAGLVLYAVNNMDFFQKKVESEVTDSGAGAPAATNK